MRVLAISAHPDDETLGCGGTLLKHRAQGDELYWLVATQAHAPQWPAEIISRKGDEVSAAASAYGMSEVFKLGFPTVRLDTIPRADLIDAVRGVMARVRPETVYVVHQGDIHSDHGAVFTAVMAVLKPFHMASLGVRRVRSFETLSSTDAAPAHPHRLFAPTLYNDITPYIDRKIEIMAMFATETQPDPLPRGPAAIRALARVRGATIGVEYAEAFMSVREVL